MEFSQIQGWGEDDHAAAFKTFRAGMHLIMDEAPKTRSLGIDGIALQRVAPVVLRQPANLDRAAAKAFFERYFLPHRIDATGFVTGYYEPEVEASREHTKSFVVPLYRRPPDLVEVDEQERPAGWDPEMRFARQTDAGPAPYFDRPAIEAGALAGRGLELAWLRDPVDAFFIHVQGSARLRLTGGGTIRVSYDGKSGHAYTSIGRLAVERGLLAREDAHKDGLEACLKANREAGRALMQENRSFIFFRAAVLGEEEGPIGAAGVPLTAGRSLAVDRMTMTFHTPVWADVACLPDPAEPSRPFRRLMIAQDTGSAIVGPARGDLFIGSGDAAGAFAGRIRHKATMFALLPASAEAA